MTNEIVTEQQTLETEDTIADFNQPGKAPTASDTSPKRYEDYVKKQVTEDKAPEQKTQQVVEPAGVDYEAQYNELRKAYSKMGNEVGEMRKLLQKKVEQDLGLTDDSDKPKAPKEITADDLLENPAEAVDEALKNSQAYKDMVKGQKADKAAKAEEMSNIQRMAVDKDFDGWQEVAGSPEFRSWVELNNQRVNMYNHANEKADFGTAYDLFSMYKEVQPEAFKEQAQGQAETQIARKEALAAATTPTQSREAPKKRVMYRSSDVVKLQNTNPGKYKQLMQGDLGAAYREGRVLR